MQEEHDDSSILFFHSFYTQGFTAEITIHIMDERSTQHVLVVLAKEKFKGNNTRELFCSHVRTRRIFFKKYQHIFCHFFEKYNFRPLNCEEESNDIGIIFIIM